MAASRLQPPHGFTNIPVATKSLLTLANVVLDHAGDYRAIASNADGDSATSQAASLTDHATVTQILAGPAGRGHSRWRSCELGGI